MEALFLFLRSVMWPIDETQDKVVIYQRVRCTSRLVCVFINISSCMGDTRNSCWVSVVGVKVVGGE